MKIILGLGGLLILLIIAFLFTQISLVFLVRKQRQLSKIKHLQLTSQKLRKKNK